MTKLRAVFIFAVLVVLISIRSTIQTQAYIYDIVTDVHAFALDAFEWSSDSSRLAFYNHELDPEAHGSPTSVVLQKPFWQFFDLQAQSLSQPQMNWPLSPLPVHPSLKETVETQFVKVSPSGNYLFYTSQPNEQTGIPDAPIPPAELRLADTATGETLSADVPMWLGGFLAADPVVLWSEAGDMAVMMLFTSAVGDILVTHISITETAPLTIERHDFKNALIGSSQFTAVGPHIDRLYDMSDDGKLVLVTGQRADLSLREASAKSQLVLWSINAADEGQVIDIFDADNVCHAAFVPGTSDEIMIVTRDSHFYLYNIPAKSVAHLPIDDIEACSDRLSFSPDGRWLATALDQFENRLAFVDIEALLRREIPVQLNPPIANAGPDFSVEDADGDGKVKVTLDGSGSSDADGTVVHYRWGSEGSSGVTADAQGRISVEYDASNFSTRTYTLTVTDNNGLQDTNTVTVTFSP